MCGTWSTVSNINIFLLERSDIALPLPSDGGVQEVPLQIPAHGRCDAHVLCVALGLKSEILTSSFKNYVRILLSLCLVMVVYKRFPYKSLRRGAVMLMSSVWGIQSVILTASCKNYILIFLSLCLVMVVYKRFPYKSLRTVAVMLISSVWHGVYSQ